MRKKVTLTTNAIQFFFKHSQQRKLKKMYLHQNGKNVKRF